MGARNLYRLFIDTGAFIAIIDERDPLHQDASSFLHINKETCNLNNQLIGYF